MIAEFNESDRDALVEDSIQEESVEEEQAEEVVDQTAEEVGEGNEEETKEGPEEEEAGEEVEEETEESAEEEETEEEGDKEFNVKYYDREGQEYEENFTEKDLPSIMSLAKEGVSAMEYAQEVSPIIDTFSKSKILQDVAYYISQGYTDDQIKKGLPQIWSKDTGEPKEFDSIEEEIDYRVEQQLKQKLANMEDKLTHTEEMAKRLAEEKSTAAIQDTNRNVFQSALNKMGYDVGDLTANELSAIDRTFADIYPGVDLMRMQLTHAQANIIVKDALNPKGIKRAKKNKVKSMSKQAQATRSMPGNAQRAKATDDKYVPRAVPRSEAERARRVDEIFS